jgi:hypothetical protein
MNMKRLMKASLVIAVMGIGYFQVVAQESVQQVCLGSGVHCATLDYGTIKMTFVKSPKAPGILIKETK